MRSRTMNATGLGSKSHENDRDVTLSPRLELDFDCPAQHHFSVTFSYRGRAAPGLGLPPVLGAGPPLRRGASRRGARQAGPIPLGHAA